MSENICDICTRYHHGAPDTETAPPEPVDEQDDINHPSHYTSHPSGIECIQITEWLNFCLGNATKYIWRAGLKGGVAKRIEDLKKAVWYIEREIDRLQRMERKE